MNKTIICIVGKTGTSKDTIARYIKSKYGINSICSYTTRPKRDIETDGVEHYFITKEEMDRLKREEHIIAYTINDKTGIEYCATAESIKTENIVYIINPNGIVYLKEHLPDGFKLLILYCNLDENIIRERVLKRGDIPAVFEKRLASEREEFDTFRDNVEYDYLINTEKSFDEIYSDVDYALRNLVK